MVKKITGVTVQLGNRKWRFSEEAGAPMATEQRATLVIGDERVFTESEVRAMMDEVKAIAAEHSRKCYTNRIEQMTPPSPVAFHIDNYLWKSHGFSSDPA